MSHSISLHLFYCLIIWVILLDNSGRVFFCLVLVLLHVFHVLVAIRELKKLLLLDAIDILELSLPIPVLVKQVIVALQFLGDFAHQMQVLLGFIP